MKSSALTKLALNRRTCGKETTACVQIVKHGMHYEKSQEKVKRYDHNVSNYSTECNNVSTYSNVHWTNMYCQ